MLKNGGEGAIGDCTVAGAMHACMLWRKVVKKPVLFTDMDAQADYFAITGGGDDGVNMLDQANYWQKVGFRDSMGNRHQILAYMHIDPKNLDHVDAACYLFDVVGFGIAVGTEEEQDFDHGEPWDDPTSPVEGYHYVPMVYKDADHRTVITWGGEQAITQDWYEGKCNEVVAVLTDENLISGKSLEGFDLDRLKADLIAVA
jgi:hypothetical protein